MFFKLVIVVVEGLVVGVGFLLVLVCDFVIVVLDVKFVMVYVNVVFILDGGGLWYIVCFLLCLLVSEIIMFGKFVSVEWFVYFGFINEVVKFGEVLDQVLVLVEKFVV